jgi:hypothetical protein
MMLCATFFRLDFCTSSGSCSCSAAEADEATEFLRCCRLRRALCVLFDVVVAGCREGDREGIEGRGDT